MIYLLLFLVILGIFLLLYIGDRAGIRKGWFKPIKIEGKLTLTEEDMENLKMGYLLRRHLNHRFVEIYLDHEADHNNIKEEDIVVKLVGRSQIDHI